jgi:hypothetical protein
MTSTSLVPLSNQHQHHLTTLVVVAYVLAELAPLNINPSSLKFSWS